MKRMTVIPLLAVLIACSCNGTSGTDDTAVKDPEAPTGLKLHSATETSLTFQWSAMEGATSYDWKLKQGSESVSSGTVKSRNVSVDGLTKATNYTFSVASVGESGKKSAYSTLEAKTEGEEGGDNNGNGENGGDDNGGNVDENLYGLFEIPAVEDDDKTPRAFPGADGGGMWATGGRGGSVYHVTNLNNSGEGSLRYGIETAGRPLTIVFDVAGVIELGSMLNIKKGDLTIAGQTAPGDGICLKNYTFRISASNVIVRFIRCRMGDEKKSEDDAIQILNRDTPYENIVIDHCSVSWCTDECASFYGMKNFTFSWNFVTESLRVSIHGKGNHGYGGIWGGENATYHHNLLAHHDSRNPRIDHDYVSTQKGPVSILNNVVYNWSGNTCYGGESSSNNGSDYRKYNFVGNYYKPGPATPSNHMWLLDPTTSCSNCGGTILPGHFYMTGNVLYGKSSVSADNWTGTTAGSSTIAKIKSTEPFSGNLVCLQSADDAFNAVLAYAGASYARDAIDTRIAGEVKDGSFTYTGSKGGTKGLIDTQTDVGGWPDYSYDKNDENLRDSDSDGMPNWFEEKFGLNKSSNDSAKKTIDKNGRYTNLEMYLHYLVKDIVKGGNENASYTKL